jgi:osmotically-inducible protein OsmY
MKTDRDLQNEVLAALQWEPGIDAAQIGVTVRDGVVTLQGTATTLVEKWVAERVARHLRGVRALTNDIRVTPTADLARSDSAIAAAAANALDWDSAVPAGVVKPTVRHGWVTLNGTVQWQFQKIAAETAVQRLLGVKGVANSIEVKPAMNAADVKEKIESAFRRTAVIDAHQVTVESRDGTVVLRGAVHSLRERDEAERAALSALGVTSVDDRLVVVP